MSKGPPKLPAMSDVHQLFNPSVTPPLVATKNVSPSGSIRKGINKKAISGPTNFRHIIHIGSDKVEVYDEKGFPLGSADKKQTFEKEVERKNGGFGMNVKTLESGKTVISLVQPGGAADSHGIMIDDEITHIDGDPVEGLAHDDVIAKIKGKNQVKLKLARYTAVPASTASGPSAIISPTQSEGEALTCRVCSALATFNCSACGPSVTYCSVECQKADWPTHKIDCQATKQKVKDEGEGGIPNTGACRVCRAKNARYRCVCGGAMYCSQQCQMADWPNHKNNCTALDQEAPKAAVDPSKFTFFTVAEKWLSKMVFVNGVFDCKWTILLTCPDDKLTLFPTIHLSPSALFVTYGDRVISIDSESGSTNWVSPIGFPADGSPMSIIHWEDVVLIGAVGHVIAIERRSGEELWRKVLSRSFAPVTLLIRSNILFAACDQNAYCIIVEDEDAHLIWRTQAAPGKYPKALSLLDGPKNTSNLIVVGDQLVTCKANDGEVQSTKDLSHASCSSTTSVKGDIFLVLRNGVLYRFDPKDFSLIWKIEIPECEGKEGTLLQNSIVFVSETPAENPPLSDVVYVGIFCRVVAIDAAAGEIRWVAKLTKVEGEMSGIVSMVLLGDDLIAATTGRVFALSANSGNPLRKAQLPQKDNPGRLISIVTQDYSERTTSCLGSLGSLFARS